MAKHISFSPNSLRISLETNENILSLDLTSAKYLELLFSSRNVKGNKNLFGTLNNTKTRNGAYFLRTSIIQPFNGKWILQRDFETFFYHKNFTSKY